MSLQFIIGTGIETVIVTIITAVCLLLAIKMYSFDEHFDGSFFKVILIAIITTLVGLLPGYIGMIGATVVLLILLCKWLDADFEEAIVITVVARFIALIALIYLPMIMEKFSFLQGLEN